MRYLNKTNTIAPISALESVEPYCITREITEEEEKTLKELAYSKSRGYLVQYTGQVHERPTRKKIEYVTAAEVGFDDAFVIAAQTKGTTEEISTSMTTADKIDEAQEKEASLLSIDDKDDAELTEDSEDWEKSSGASFEDVDEEQQRQHYSTFIQKSKDKKNPLGAKETNLLEITKEQVKELDAALNPPNASVSAAELQKVASDSDESENVVGAPKNVNEFLVKNFFTKKWNITKTDDKEFLNEVLKWTKSENIKALINQRLQELA